MKRASLVALALAATSVTLAGARPAGDSPVSLVFAAISAPARVSYTGTVEAKRVENRGVETAVYRVEHRAPDLTCRNYFAPAALSGDSVVSEGARTLSVDPRRHDVVETSDATGDAAALNADSTLLRDNYRINVTRSETFDGRAAIDLELINKYSGRATMLLRLDRATRIVLDRQEFDSTGALVSEIRFEQIRYAASIPSADFAVPAGYARVRETSVAQSLGDAGDAIQRAGFAARAPRSLPGGFSAIEGTVVNVRGIRTLHLLYSDGLRTVSLFETSVATRLDATALQPQMLRIGTENAEYVVDGSTALLAWSDGGLHYTLAGELGLVDFTHLAESLQR